MGIVCKGTCHKYKAKKPTNAGRYISGQKRCNSCEIFIKYDGLYCPCCHHKLRLGPRNTKNKQKLLKDLQNEKSSLNDYKIKNVAS